MPRNQSYSYKHRNQHQRSPSPKALEIDLGERGGAAWLTANVELVASDAGMKRLRHYVRKFEKAGKDLAELNWELRLILQEEVITEDDMNIFLTDPEYE